MSAGDARRHGRGTFVAVVGPSGAGKDTLIRLALARRTGLVAARRVISRPPHAHSEDHESVGEAEFARRRADGAFALDWRAHALRYAIPAVVEAELVAGRHVLANLSRQAVQEAREKYRPFRVLVVTAPAEVLAARLSARGREDAAAVAARLARADLGGPPAAPDLVVIDNGGTMEDGLRAFLAALPAQPVSS